MHFKVLNFLKIIVIIIFIFVTNSVEASKLIFDISNSHITLSNKKKDSDFTVYGFSDSKQTLVLKITGPRQKVILQKKKKILECGLGEKQASLVILV